MVETPPPTTENGPQADGIPSISLLGVKINRVDMAATLDAIRGFIKSGEPHMIVTADASMVVRAREDEEFRNILNNADLITPDGSGILKGASMLGTPLIERVSGCDICQELCRLSAEEGFSIFFLGSEPGIAEQAAENLKKDYPGMHVAGTHHGYFRPDEDAIIVKMVRDSGATILLAGMGIPRQEKWIVKYRNELGVSVAMGVGGSMDVFAGKVKRAPVWFQKHGLEWAYRLANDPSKIRKVAVLPRFMWMVMKERQQARMQNEE
ncbi:MAG: WecB/TagA/CpsF family glycosyltransferase [Armatimonadetes bacterium]|nr:WecB/TagA/CpsF family glycosyltransferase [Armatimonadota bacterium]